MTLVRAVDEPRYPPEYGILMVRDRRRSDGSVVPPPTTSRALEEWDELLYPTGSFAGAGNGWLAADSADCDQEVRLEYHDREPDAHHDEWADVVETPYFCGTGVVELALLTGSDGLPGVELGPAGRYRVRICRRGESPEYAWLIQFFPDAASDVPPRWFRRSAELTGHVPYAADLTSLVAWSTPLSSTLSDLADRLLLPIDLTREVVVYAVRDERVESRGNLGDLDGLLRLEVPAPKPVEPLLDEPSADPASAESIHSVRAADVARERAAFRVSFGGDAPFPVDQTELPHLRPADPTEPPLTMTFSATSFGSAQGSASGPELPPDGGPPRAGIIDTDGNVVRWHGVEPEVVGTLAPERWYDAFECAVGVVVAGPSGLRLVSHGGDVDELGAGYAPREVRVSADGRLLAYVE